MKKKLSQMLVPLIIFGGAGFFFGNALLWNSGASYTYAEREIFSAAFMVTFLLCIMMLGMRQDLLNRIEALEKKLEK